MKALFYDLRDLSNFLTLDPYPSKTQLKTPITIKNCRVPETRIRRTPPECTNYTPAPTLTSQELIITFCHFTQTPKQIDFSTSITTFSFNLTSFYSRVGKTNKTFRRVKIT